MTAWCRSSASMSGCSMAATGPVPGLSSCSSASRTLSSRYAGPKSLRRSGEVALSDDATPFCPPIIAPVTVRVAQATAGAPAARPPPVAGGPPREAPATATGMQSDSASALDRSNALDRVCELLGAPRLWRAARLRGQTGGTNERCAALTPLGYRGWPRPVLAAAPALAKHRPGGHVRRAPAVR
jgi:hypothetical protein